MAEPYTPGILSDTYDPQQLQFELEKLASALEEYTGSKLILEPQAVEPDRMVEGMVVNADGTYWDPGSGQGFYAWVNGAWAFLGSGGASDGIWLFKTADETRNNDNTLTADTDLQTPVDANTGYAFWGWVTYVSDASADFAYVISEPDGVMMAILHKGNEGVGSLGVELVDESWSGNSTATGGTTRYIVYFTGYLVTGVAGGTFSFDWSQNLSNANDTTVKKGSWMRVKKLTV